MVQRTLFFLFLYLLPSYGFAAKRLAVLEFRGIGVEEALLTVLADKARAGALDASQGRDIGGGELMVMTRENMVDMLSQMGKGAEDCRGECEVEMARNIGADYVLSGELVKVEGLYILSVKLHETEKGRLLGADGAESESFRDLLPAAQTLSGKLIRKGLGLGGGGTSSPSVQTGFTGGGASSWSASSAGGEQVVVKFQSTPPGASVYLDGTLLCSETPCSKHVSGGAHEARFSLQRHAEDTKSFTAAEGASVQGSLAPQFGTVKVTSQPPGAEIQVDGKSWGTAPFGKELDPGLYALKVASSCHEPIGYNLLMKSGAT